MVFEPKNFRRLGPGSMPPVKIRTNEGATLILVKSSGEAMYARTRGEKDSLVAAFNAGADLLLWPWVGQYHTDVFMLTQDDLEAHYR